MVDNKQVERLGSVVLKFKGNKVSVYFSKDYDSKRKTVQSVVDLEDSTCFTLNYIKQILLFQLFMGECRNVLIVGLGGGSLTRYFYTRFPESKIVSLESNKDMVEANLQHLKTPQDDRSEIVLEKGQDYADRMVTENVEFDLIISDVFNDNDSGFSVAAGVNTPEYFSNLKRLLSKDGLLMVNTLFQKRSFRKVISDVFDGGVMNLSYSKGLGNDVLMAYHPERIGEMYTLDDLRVNVNSLPDAERFDLSLTFEKILNDMNRFTNKRLIM